MFFLGLFLICLVDDIVRVWNIEEGENYMFNRNNYGSFINVKID